MQRHRSWLTLVLVAAALVAVPGIDAWSQSARPIRVVLPFAPGGPADAMARLLAEQIGSAGGPTMVVESRPGAGTEIATEYVSRADPDGNTLWSQSARSIRVVLSFAPGGPADA